MSYIKYKLLQAYLSTSSAEPVIPEFNVNNRNKYFKFEFSLGSLKEDLELAKTDVAWNVSTAYDIVVKTGKTNLENYYYSFGTDGNTERTWEKFNGALCIKIDSFADDEKTIIWFVGDGSEYINFNVVGSAADGLLKAFNSPNLPSDLIIHKDGQPAQEDIAISGHLGSLYYGVNISKYDSNYISEKVTFKNTKIGNISGFDTNYRLTKNLFADHDTDSPYSPLYRYGRPGGTDNIINKLSIGTSTYKSEGYGAMFSGLIANAVTITNRYYARNTGTADEYYQAMINTAYTSGTNLTLETPSDFYSILYDGCQIRNGINLDINTYLPKVENEITNKHTTAKPVPFALKYKTDEIPGSADIGHKDDYIEGNWSNIIEAINNTGLQEIISNVNDSHSSTAQTQPKVLNLGGDLPALPAKTQTRLYDKYLGYYNKLYTKINENGKLNDWEIYIQNKIWKAGAVTIYFVEDIDADYTSAGLRYIHRITIDKIIDDNGTIRNSKIKDLPDKIKIKTSKYGVDFSLVQSNYNYIPYMSGNNPVTNSNNDNPNLPVLRFYNIKYSIINYKGNGSNPYDKTSTNFIYRRKIVNPSSSSPYKDVLVNPDTDLYDGMVLYIYTGGSEILYQNGHDWESANSGLGYYYDSYNNYNIKSNYDDDLSWLIFENPQYKDYTYSFT